MSGLKDASGAVWPEPDPFWSTGSFWNTLIAVIVTGSPSGSVTPEIEIGTIPWFGGHTLVGAAVAALQTGGLLAKGVMATPSGLIPTGTVATIVLVAVAIT